MCCATCANSAARACCWSAVTNCSAHWPAIRQCAPIAASPSRKLTRCCARWKPPNAQTSATTAARPGASWPCPIWTNSSCAVNNMAATSEVTAASLAVAIMGPTASGKTAAALEIARHIPCEIISVDSALVYREMDIGTAKPNAEELASVPHHLIDILDPSEAYSAMQFRNDALRLAQDIRARGKLPLLVGGTMLYFKVLRDGLDDLPEADPAVRARLDDEAARNGVPAQHARLATLDPETATRLKPNDSQRIQRALEIIELTGRPMSTLLTQQSAQALPFTLLPLALEPSDRAVLHARIARRFDLMLENDGLLDEVRALRARRPAPGAAGYALRRLPPGLGIPRRPVRLRRDARTRHHCHATTGQAADHLVAFNAGASGGGLQC